MDFDINDGKIEADIQNAVKWLEEAYRSDESILDKFIDVRTVF